MKDEKIENLVGALALALSDGVLGVAQGSAPDNISSAGIALVGHAPGITIHELSRGLKLSHPGAVRLVDRMAADDLVTRRRSQEDGRAVTLHLTDTGHAMEREILASRRGMLHEALAALPDTDRAAFGRIAQAILTAVVRDPDHAMRICRLCDGSACEDCPVEAELMIRDEAVET